MKKKPRKVWERSNPCKGREVGCTADPAPGCLRCDNCRTVHNARERDRRQARRSAGKCTVCGAPAVKVGGVCLSTCQVHREYYAERARGL